ncbi:MAG: branched-chain amino acid transaminase [Longimicrobiales bacterium]
MTNPRTDWIWKNGKWLRWDAANIHVGSHVVHYGSSVFEGIRCYATPRGPAVFRLRAHVRRLLDSARIYRMTPPFDEAQIIDACCAVVARNRQEACYIRPVVLRGSGSFGIDPRNCAIDTFILCFPWGAYLGDASLKQGVDACVSSWQRAAPNTIPALAKAGGNYLSSQLIKMEAQSNGYAEGIALGPDGLVSEGSGQNVFLVRDGVLMTPAVDGTLLPGITRDCVLTLARDLGIPVREQAVPRELLYIADEVFFAGTAVEITPIRSIDRVPIGAGRPGEVTSRLQERLLGIARGLQADEHDWLTPVDLRVPSARGRRRTVAA